MNKKILKILSLFFFMTSIGFGFSVKIDKTKIYKDANPGDVVEGVINVINDSDKSNNMNIDIEDINFDAQAQNMVFKPFGTQSDSCSRWIQITPKNFEIQAGTSKALNYVITVPKENLEYAEYYSIIFVTSDVDSQDMSQSLVLASRARIGVIVKIIISPLSKPSGKIDVFKVEPANGKEPLAVIYEFTNSGNILQKVNGSFSIIDKTGNLFGRGTLKTGVAKPQDHIVIKTLWDGELEAGVYDLIAEFKWDPNIVEIKEVNFDAQYVSN